MIKNILAADIGGTNSRFGQFQVGTGGELEKVHSTWLKTGESQSFQHLMDMLKDSDFPLDPGDADVCVFAVAGPVQKGERSKPPNIHWTIDLSSTPEESGISRCLLINDFVAQAYGCRSPLAEKYAVNVLGGTLDDSETLAVIGAGTGLGKASLTPDGHGGFVAVASEGGHINFPFVTGDEMKYQRFLWEKTGQDYINYDMVVSGRGLSFVHEFLTGTSLSPREVGESLTPESPTLHWFSRFYGRACRNYTLEVLAMGGVYISGGIAAKLPLLVRHSTFASEFRASPDMEHILQNLPVFLLTEQETGLWGAAVKGKQLLTRER